MGGVGAGSLAVQESSFGMELILCVQNHLSISA